MISIKFRFAGADVLKTKWPSFLEPCSEKMKKWKLPPDIYKDYSRGKYIVPLLRALTKAAEIYNAQVASENDHIVIPTGNKIEDWKVLESVLNRIGTSEGREREFWACQGFYASEETGKESSVLEQAANILGRTSNNNKIRTVLWITFRKPAECHDYKDGF